MVESTGPRLVDRMRAAYAEHLAWYESLDDEGRAAWDAKKRVKREALARIWELEEGLGLDEI